MSNMDAEKMEKGEPAPQVADVDAALEYLNHEGTTTMTEVNEKALVRKLDFTIVPLMC